MFYSYKKDIYLDTLLEKGLSTAAAVAFKERNRFFFISAPQLSPTGK